MITCIEFLISRSVYIFICGFGWFHFRRVGDKLRKNPPFSSYKQRKYKWNIVQFDACLASIDQGQRRNVPEVTSTDFFYPEEIEGLVYATDKSSFKS